MSEASPIISKFPAKTLGLFSHTFQMQRLLKVKSCLIKLYFPARVYYDGRGQILLCWCCLENNSKQHSLKPFPTYLQCDFKRELSRKLTGSKLVFWYPTETTSLWKENHYTGKIYPQALFFKSRFTDTERYVKLYKVAS